MANKGFYTVLALLLSFLGAVAAVSAQGQEQGARSDSGGVLMPEQAAYDVKSYDLNLRVDIPGQSIKGTEIVKAEIINPIDKFVLDLDTPFTVESVAYVAVKNLSPLAFERRGGQIWISLPKMMQRGERVEIYINYSGKPRVAVNPPWDGGFVWRKTADGSPWIAVACETEGADLWIPIKDHPSDEPDTVSLHYTVPNNLIAAGNGKLQSVVKNDDGTQTFNWFVSQPINNYNITLAIAPYKVIEDNIKSISGEMIPVRFYVLPEHAAKAPSLVELVKKYNAFYEQYLGPYPFRADKIGIVETPHLGMEHQTLIAYGNNFNYDKSGHDWLLFHEFGHEWWGNLVTASDWRDFWIHEGFQSFMDTLYVEKTKGREAYFKKMKSAYAGLKNVRAVAPRQPSTQIQMSYLPPDYKADDEDVYGKGALILNSLRYLIGDEAFFRSLRRMAYPTPEMEKITDGRQTRLVTTDDYMRLAEKESGKKLDWFFEVYLRQPALPKLIVETKPNQLTLRWETPNNLPFQMPVEVKIGNDFKRIEMPNGTATIALPQNTPYAVDPNGWALRVQN